MPADTIQKELTKNKTKKIIDDIVAFIYLLILFLLLSVLEMISSM